MPKWRPLIRLASANKKLKQMPTDTQANKNSIAALLIAVQFLSCLPTGKQAMPTERDIGASLSWYPVVGLLLGCLVAVIAWLSAQLFPPLLSAALCLSFWAFLTGALHIDGLADCADAWLGGLGSKDRTLALMKDPTSGPIAVTVVILLLLLKLCALELLIRNEAYSLVIWPLVFARMSSGLLFLSTPYARESGLGSAIARYKQKNHILGIGALVSLMASLFIGWFIVPIIISLALSFYYLRHKMMARIDGCTGDTAGALIEISECLALLVLAALIAQ